MYQNQGVKSATVAGLLGIFLGAVGAHNWYLGDKKKGIIHVSLVGGSIVIAVIVNIILNTMAKSNPLGLLTMAISQPWWYLLGVSAAGLAASVSGIWGFIEGVTILSQGDAGLAQKGYNVAQPAPMQSYGQPMNNSYNQPMNNGFNQPMNGYNQPMNNGYGQPMNGYNQPMNNGYGMPMNNGMEPNNMNNMNGNNNQDGNMGGNENGQQQF